MSSGHAIEAEAAMIEHEHERKEAPLLDVDEEPGSSPAGGDRDEEAALDLLLLL
jgi:hypothetical protein